jgi:hypothetical protein
MEALSELMEEHCVPEFERISTFHSFKVLKWKEEGLEIVRMALMLKPESSVDVLLRKLEVGLKLTDVVSELNASMQFSAPLTEMVESSKFVLGQHLSGSGTLQLIVARKIWGTLLEEVMYHLESKESAARVENAERRGGYKSAWQRTREALLGLKSANSNSNNSNPSDSSSTPSVAKAEEPSITGWRSGQRTRTDAEIGARHHQATGWRFLAWSVVSLLRSAKANTTELRFENAAELLLGNAFVNARLPAWLTRSVVEAPGGLATMWKGYCFFLNQQLDKHWRRVVNHEKAQKVWADHEGRKREEKLAKMTDKERARLAFEEEKRALAEQLASLGLDGEAGMEVVQEELSDMQRARKSKTERVASERRVLEAYEAVHKALFSVQAVTLQSGLHRLDLNFQGLDIFELLPQPPPSPPCLAP